MLPPTFTSKHLISFSIFRRYMTATPKTRPTMLNVSSSQSLPNNEVYLSSIRLNMQRAADQFPKSSCISSRHCDCQHTSRTCRTCRTCRTSRSCRTGRTGPLSCSITPTMAMARGSDIRSPDSRKAGSHSEWDVSRMLEQERAAVTPEPVPDAQMAKTFASAIDDIIKGRRPGRRSRAKVRMDKSKSRAERPKSRTERAYVCCEKCGASFASVGNLNRHRRVSHQGLRVYCDFPECHQVRLRPFCSSIHIFCRSSHPLCQPDPTTTNRHVTDAC